MLFLPGLQSVLPDTTISLRNISRCYCITDYSTLPLFLLLQQSSRLTTVLAVWGGAGELFQKGKFRKTQHSFLPMPGLGDWVRNLCENPSTTGRLEDYVERQDGLISLPSQLKCLKSEATRNHSGVHKFYDTQHLNIQRQWENISKILNRLRGPTVRITKSFKAILTLTT